MLASTYLRHDIYQNGSKILGIQLVDNYMAKVLTWYIHLYIPNIGIYVGIASSYIPFNKIIDLNKRYLYISLLGKIHLSLFIVSN
jgi:hypothetical protein